MVGLIALVGYAFIVILTSIIARHRGRRETWAFLPLAVGWTSGFTITQGLMLAGYGVDEARPVVLSANLTIQVLVMLGLALVLRSAEGERPFSTLLSFDTVERLSERLFDWSVPIGVAGIVVAVATGLVVLRPWEMAAASLAPTTSEARAPQAASPRITARIEAWRLAAVHVPPNPRPLPDEEVDLASCRRDCAWAVAEVLLELGETGGIDPSRAVLEQLDAGEPFRAASQEVLGPKSLARMGARPALPIEVAVLAESMTANTHEILGDLCDLRTADQALVFLGFLGHVLDDLERAGVPKAHRDPWSWVDAGALERAIDCP